MIADTIPGYSFNPHNLTYTFDYNRTHEHRKIREENKLMRIELNSYYLFENTADSIYQMNLSMINSLNYIIDQYQLMSASYNIISINKGLQKDLNKHLVEKSIVVNKNLNRDLRKARFWKKIYKWSALSGLLIGGIISLVLF